MVLFYLSAGTYCINLEEQSRVLNILLTKYPDLKESLKEYTGSFYKGINNTLKGKECIHDYDEKFSSKISKFINDIKKIFKNIPSYKFNGYDVLFRGVDYYDLKEFNEFIDSKIVKEIGFVSTTTDISIAYDYSIFKIYSIIMIIFIDGTLENKILPVKDLSYHKNEYEVILPNNSKFVYLDKFDNIKYNFIGTKKVNTYLRPYLYIPDNQNNIDEIINNFYLNKDKIIEKQIYSFKSQIIEINKNRMLDYENISNNNDTIFDFDDSGYKIEIIEHGINMLQKMKNY